MYNSDYYTTAYLAVEGIEKGMTPENAAAATILAPGPALLDFKAVSVVLPGLFEEEGAQEDTEEETNIYAAYLEAQEDGTGTPIEKWNTPSTKKNKQVKWTSGTDPHYTP